MGFRLELNEETGKWEYEYFASAYGWAGGEADSLAAAKVELAIAEASVMESPYPPAVKEVMRSDYERFAKDYPDPPYEGMMPRV